MRGKVGVSVGTLSLCVALSHCAGETKLAKAPDEPKPSTDAAAPDAEGGAGGAPEVAATPAPEAEEPAAPLVARAVDKTGEATEKEEGELGVRFEVVELGPEGWAYAVVNRGTQKVEVAVDPRLLRFELEPPPDPNAKKWTPKPKVKTCELPAELRPGAVDRHFVVVLEPGQGVVEAFDPRLYCLPENGVSPLVPGARLTPHFGFAPKTKTLWKAGKREIVPLPEQQEPFVAHALDAEANAEPSHHSGGTDGGVGDDESEREPLREKEFVGSVLELGADYAKKAEAEETPLVLSMTRGSDARNDRQALVTVSLSSREKKPVRVYFRRELVSFQVIGPDGEATCSPEPDARAPDRAAFSLLNPGGSLTATSRLVELCPEGTFARPGLYLVQGRFDAIATGKEHGFDAFVGTVASSKPAIVRLRTGSLPFPGKRRSKLVRVGENGGVTAPAADPSPDPAPKTSPEAP
jgi:hypothetical protein